MELIQVISGTIFEAKCEGCGTVEGLTFEAHEHALQVYGDESKVWGCEECRDGWAQEV